MKRAVLFIIPIIVFFILFGCSKKHEAPTSEFDAISSLPNPTGLDVTFSKVAGDTASYKFDVSWSLVSDDRVVDYYVEWSDSTLFDPTETGDKFINSSTDNTTSVTVRYLLEDMGMKGDNFHIPENDAYVDSMVVWFAVSAVYNDGENFIDFIGPRSVPDSSTIYRPVE